MEKDETHAQSSIVLFFCSCNLLQILGTKGLVVIVVEDARTSKNSNVIGISCSIDVTFWKHL